MPIVLPEPIPIETGTPQADFYYANQMSILIQAIRNVTLTSRAGAIQNNDKAGNLNAVYCVYTSNGSANTEDTIPHKLGRVPTGYIVVKQNKAGIVYETTTAFTSTNLYLKTSAASVALVLLVF